ncbi:DUF4293 domain-containing protein [Flavobacterium agrisoli]|uniref:DUF4293 domain-containing protein n=1 Tax=Flavobacterium agrisoli TaxID=2793066 RepID=A0A934PL41_9FLAO|nr:DUF4293 domain-containing protein [Flavobacterium agrisoli]MBK0368353.1 DUF4293 domain-containing protein [Flavobacterium agrisoli]
MIQRIQTIYLLLTFAISAILFFLFPLWTLENGKVVYFMESHLYTILLGLSTMLSVMSIISFKKRQNQFVMNRLNMIINLSLLGLFVYHSLNLSGETPAVSEKGIGMFLPIVAIVLLVLANRAIKKDEDLVKSADRLR